MQTSISKRLLAGLLSIVMVLSLFIATPAKTEAADNEVLSVKLGCFVGATPVEGLHGSSYVADAGVEQVKIGATDVTAKIYYGGVDVNNGSYDLDPDVRIGNATREINITLLPADIDDYKNIKTAQVFLGRMAANKTLGWEKADFVIVGRYVIVTVKTTRYDNTVAQGDILGLKTPISYQYYFPTTLTGFQVVYFSLGALTWKYTADDGAHWSYPTYPILGSAQNPGEYYEVETVISANPGFVLPAEFANVVAADGVRKFTLKDRSTDGKSAILVISNIIPTTAAKFQDPSITSIELTRYMNFGTNEVNLPADVTSKMPTSFYVTVNGERKEVKSTLLANGTAEWVVYAVSGGSLRRMDPNEPIQKSNTWDLPNVVNKYYAVLEVNARFVNRYNITADEFLPVRADLFYASLADGHQLLEEYDAYIQSGAGLNTGATYGWVIEFTVNDERSYGVGTSTAVEALKQIDAPTINFYGYGTAYTAYAFGQGTTHFFMKDLAGTTYDADNATHVCPVANGAIYKAYVDGTANFSVGSPVVFAYFDVTANATSEVKTGALSIAMGTPWPDTRVFHNIDGMAASMDLAKAIDTSAAAIADIEVGWDGITVSGMNYGDEYFDFFDELTAYMFIPVMDGYKLGFTPEVKINGEAASTVEIVEQDGKTYIYVEKTYTLEGYGYIGNSIAMGGEYCFKQPFTNIKVPKAGAAVQKTLELSGSTKEYAYEFDDIVWYENGVEFEGETFTKGKRYTAVVTIAQPYIMQDVTSLAVLQGNVKALTTAGQYITQAKAVASKGLVTITFEFGECTQAQLQAVADLIINVPNGMATADFYQYVINHLYPELIYVGGETGVGTVASFTVNGTTYPATVAGLGQAMDAKYPGILAYNEKLTTAQHFELGAFTPAGVGYAFNVIINVEGVKDALAFDANGGVYTGTGCVIERGKAYGFKYDPAEIYREGYLFAGWFTAAEGGTRIYAKTIADGTVKKVYAHWVKVFTGKVWTLTAKSYATGRLTVTAGKIATKYDGFEFSVSQDGINWITVNKANSKVNYFAGLAKGEYQVRVRAYRRDSAGKIVYGAYSPVVKATVK